MRRARLKPHEVTRVILTATMSPEHVSVDDLREQRRADGFLDLGWHYYVDRNAMVHFGVPVTERGSYFARYGSTSVVILVEGDGSHSNEQFLAIARLIETVQREYPNAVPTLHSELFRGTNPRFALGDIL